uniref:Predicted protein n=1 Tax=Hordeum vulgare subsp. vulgare TaxID=112509 RepID=F2DWZ6_HORVV|nr:predicted protein [Hordeum vulgare subsp. vulgare]
MARAGCGGRAQACGEELQGRVVPQQAQAHLKHLKLCCRMFLNLELATQKKWKSGRRMMLWFLNLLLHVNNLILCSYMCSIETIVVVLVVQYQHLLDL